MGVALIQTTSLISIARGGGGGGGGMYGMAGEESVDELSDDDEYGSQDGMICPIKPWLHSFGHTETLQKVYSSSPSFGCLFWDWPTLHPLELEFLAEYLRIFELASLEVLSSN